MVLDLHGYDTRVAYDGPAGVRVATAWHPAVVLCDLGLPGLDGYAVARALRGTPATAGARLIAVTGDGSDDSRDRAFASGFQYHFTKPADTAALLEVLP